MPGEVIVHARFLEAQERHRTANRVTAAFASAGTGRPRDRRRRACRCRDRAGDRAAALDAGRHRQAAPPRAGGAVARAPAVHRPLNAAAGLHSPPAFGTLHPRARRAGGSRTRPYAFHHFARQRPQPHRGRRAGHAAPLRAAQRPRTSGPALRLRPRPVRGLHRHRQRRSGALLRPADRVGRGAPRSPPSKAWRRTGGCIRCSRRGSTSRCRSAASARTARSSPPRCCSTRTRGRATATSARRWHARCAAA